MYQKFIDRTGLCNQKQFVLVYVTKNNRTGRTNILKPEQLVLNRPVSIKRPGLYFLKKSIKQSGLSKFQILEA